MPMDDIGYMASITGFESWRIPSDNIPFSGGTTTAFATVFAASGVGSGVHGSISLLNKGVFTYDYFLGGNDAYGTLSSGLPATLAVNQLASFNLDNVSLRSGVSPLTSVEIQVKSTVLNQSGLAVIMPSVTS